MIRRVVFRPAAVRDLARLDRVVQARIDAALVRFAATGHGDVKSLNDRPGELRLRVGKWQVFFSLEPPDLVRVLGMWQQSDNVAFEQSRNVVLTSPSLGNAGRTTTDDPSR